MNPRTALSAPPIPLALIAAFGLALTACKDEEKETEAGYTDDVIDTSGTTGTTGGTTAEDCDVVVAEMVPTSGASDIYYRDALEVTFDEDASALSPVFTLTAADGTDVGVSASFSDTGFVATVVPDAPLEASTTYTLSAAICDSSASTEFTTSGYGGSLSIDATSLAGNTYWFSLGEAEYLQPEGLGPVLATFLTEPLLIGVGTSDGSLVQILGTQGVESGGEVSLDSSFPVWDFGNATLDGAYFESDPTDISLDYGCATIPIYGFSLQGTFAPDGSSIGGGAAQGLGDSSEMGCLLPGGGGNPDAVCDYGAAFGVQCDECPDGTQRCLTIEALFEVAPLLPDISLSLD